LQSIYGGKPPGPQLAACRHGKRQTAVANHCFNTTVVFASPRLSAVTLCLN
jgi:hypothetical protein